MEGVQMTATEWCFKMRDGAYAAGDEKSGRAYQELGQVWMKREQQSERGVDRSCSE